MKHEKLVTGTESPTRYTKVIRNPGAGTKYNRTYQETGYVSRYTKTVTVPASYFPEPPPPPDPDPLSTEIGEVSVTINDVPQSGDGALTLLMDDPVPVVVSITGDANPTYTWSARNDYPLMVDGSGSSVVLTFPEAGVVTATCTIIDNTATDSPKAHAINFYIVDAETYDELKNKGEI